MEKDLNIVVIGGVSSSEILIKELKCYKFENVKLFSYKPKNIKNVSSYVDLALISNELGYENYSFEKVSECYDLITKIKPDILFAVGLSQIIPEEIIDVVKIASIGFHPTDLPKGRGRAPLAWLILEKEKYGASTFFLLNKNIDDGEILVSEKFLIDPNDSAKIVHQKMINAEKIALRNLLPNLSDCKSLAKPQDETRAYFYGKRSAEDGVIDWNENVNYISSLIRATSKPHPGAYSFCDDKKIIIWNGEIVEANIKGVVGKILRVDKIEKSFMVQASDGIIKIDNWECDGLIPRVGMQLGYKGMNEIYEIKKNIQKINKRLDYLEDLIIKSNKIWN